MSTATNPRMIRAPEYSVYEPPSGTNAIEMMARISARVRAQVRPRRSLAAIQKYRTTQIPCMTAKRVAAEANN